MTTPPSDRPPPRIPSHVAWPAFVLFLLVLSVAMAAVTVYAARSDGGARPAEVLPLDSARAAEP